MENQNTRNIIIIRTSIIGIMANVLLALFKALIGITSHSIAIIMDAVNNLSDAASSIITIVGTKLAGKEADKKHPFGYGRIEYLSAMGISFLVLYAGITAFVESVKKIINPQTPDYSSIALIIISVAVVVKFFLGKYVKSVGTKVNSDSLINSGEDATMDAIISVSTLFAAVLYLTIHISLEAWLGAIIAVLIVKSGLEMLGDTLSKILGEGADISLVKDIKSTIKSLPSVRGAYDLVLHNYGPDAYNGSVHIEVPDSLTADEIDKITRRITTEVYKKHNVILTGVGVYSFNTKEDYASEAREHISKLVTSHKNIIQMHGFYIDQEELTIRFDIVVSFEEKDKQGLLKSTKEMVLEEYPGYDVQIAMDIDF